MLKMLAGVLVASIMEVGEVIDDVNAVAFIASDTAQVTAYLDEINNRATPVIFVDRLYLDDADNYVYKQPDELANALASSRHFGRLVLAFDEPLLRMRRTGQDVVAGKHIMDAIRDDFPGAEFLVVYSHQELYDRYVANNGILDIWYNADHIGYNCYGKYYACGPHNIPQLTFLQLLYADIKRNGSNAGMFIVPGAFTGLPDMQDEAMIIDSLHWHVHVATYNRDIVSGFGVFAWGDADTGVIGARNSPGLSAAVKTATGILINEPRINQ